MYKTLILSQQRTCKSDQICKIQNVQNVTGLLRWRRGSWLDCGSEDPGYIPSKLSPCMGPLMDRRLKTSSEVKVPLLG